MSGEIPDRGVILRPATEPELPACRMLLPEAFGWGTAPDFVLALSQDPLRFLGAAAFITARRRADRRPILRVGVRVASPHRRGGVGSQLLNALKDAAARRGIDVLSASADRRLHGDYADFLVARGFTSVERLHTFEVDLQRMVDFFVARRDWLVGRGEFPPDARIVSLREAPTRQIAELFAAHLGGMDDHVESHLRLWADSMTDNLGFALMLGGEVRAAILHRLEGEIATTEALVVAPDFRGDGDRNGWANILLSARAIDWYSASGIRRVRYIISASNPRAMKQYLRFDPDEVEVRETYELAC